MRLSRYVNPVTNAIPSVIAREDKEGVGSGQYEMGVMAY